MPGAGSRVKSTAHTARRLKRGRNGPLARMTIGLHRASIMNEQHYLTPLFEPRSVAVIGATEREKSRSATSVVRNMLEAGFKGKLFAVNPKYEQVLGVTLLHAASRTSPTASTSPSSPPRPTAYRPSSTPAAAPAPRRW